MNILEMLSFDFMGFVTSPAGILIIVGILCLLIGIVMFLKEGKNKTATEEKKPEETVEKKEETENTSVETITEVETTPTVTPEVESINETTPVVVPSEGDGVKEVTVEPVAETINFTEPTTEVPKVEELKAEPLDMPVVTPVEPITEAPAVTPVEPVTEAPVVESLDTEEVTTQPVVYGGASPEVLNTEVLEEKPREIYGGASPLENTSPIPVVSEPTAEAPAITPVEPVTEAPTVEPVVQVTEAPAVVTPTVEPVQENKEELEKLEF